ncbi:zinc finger protein 628 [Culex quinquefasciatus]|uniref:zinc finger protein 628 n=1 Tax=Culex quinquefasciatus TaxID=7176 RepID=UPI0018E2ECD6|nr:zinc finger protein 628 [Culex quinquefasciatus]
MQVPSSNPTEYCRLCFSQHSLQNVLEKFDPSKLLLTQMQNCLGLWLAPEQDFPCAVCRLCASALDTFQAFRERTGECDQVIKQLRKVGEVLAPVESIKVEILDDEGGSDAEEGALVIDEPEPVNEEDSEVETQPTVLPEPVWVPVENAKPRRSARYVCMECENTFSCSQALARHQREIHGDEETPPSPRRKKGKTRHYSCGQCSAVFYGYGAALTHLAQAHKTTGEEAVAEMITGDVEQQVAPSSNTPTPPPKKAKPKKTLKCHNCPKMFLCMRTLDVHMRTACKVQMTQTSDSIVSISPKELRKQLFGSAPRGTHRPTNSTGSCFRCGICNEVIVGSSAFLAHRRNVHGGTTTGESPAKKSATEGTEA